MAAAAAAVAAAQDFRRALLPGGLTVALGSSSQKMEAVRTTPSKPPVTPTT